MLLPTATVMVPWEGGGGLLGLTLFGMCRWPLRMNYPIIVYCVANNKPHLSHFW